jgi:chorismate mutase/prephenate dehydratase
MPMSRAAGQTFRVAYMGPEGSFSHEAARLRFGPRGARYLPASDIHRVVEAVLGGTADLGVVPIENTTGGMIGDTLDSIMNGLLPGRGFAITEECHLDVKLALLGREAGGPIRRIYSHEVPLKHCRDWIRANLPGAACEKVVSTSRAAALAARHRDAAAIGAPDAGRRYGLHVLRYPLLPERPNRTSFFLLGRARRAPARAARGGWKVGLAVSLSHRPGSLYRALGILAARRLNMTRIESRPLPDRPWEYKFFIEFEGGLDTPATRSALKALGRHALAVQVLGNYTVRHLIPNA